MPKGAFKKSKKKFFAARETSKKRSIDALTLKDLQTLKSGDLPAHFPKETKKIPKESAQKVIKLLVELNFPDDVEKQLKKMKRLAQNPALPEALRKIWYQQKKDLEGKIHACLALATQYSYLESVGEKQLDKLIRDLKKESGLDAIETSGSLKQLVKDAEQAIQQAESSKGLYAELLQEEKIQERLLKLEELQKTTPDEEQKRAIEKTMRLVKVKLKLPMPLELQIARLQRIANSPEINESEREIIKNIWDTREEKIRTLLKGWIEIALQPSFLMAGSHPNIHNKADSGLGKKGREQKLSALREELNAIEEVANKALVASLKAKVNNYEVFYKTNPDDRGKKLSNEEAQKTIDDLLGDRGKDALYANGRSSWLKKTSLLPATDATEKRMAFIDGFADALSSAKNEFQPRFSENGKDLRLVSPAKCTITLKELLGDSYDAYLAAVKEETRSRAYRNAVFLRSIKHYPGPTWLKKMMLWVGGPSASGKSTSTDAVVKEIGETGLIAKDPSGKKGNTVVTVDGGIERETSQMRQMVLQLALKKGYTGISDLHSKTKLAAKRRVKNAALAAHSPINIAIPETFTTGNFLLPGKKTREKNPDFLEVYSMVLASDGEDEVFQSSVSRLGNSRAWSNNFDWDHTSGRIISMNNLDIGCESKKYQPEHFKKGVWASNLARWFYFRRNTNKIYIPIFHDLIYVKPDPSKEDPRHWSQWNPSKKKGDEEENADLTVISRRDFARWRAYKARGYEGGGFPSGLDSFPVWYATLWHGYQFYPMTSFPGTSEAGKIYLEITPDGHLAFRRPPDSTKREIIKKEEIIGRLGGDRARILLDAVADLEHKREALAPYTKFLRDITQAPKLPPKTSPPKFRILKNDAVEKDKRLQAEGDHTAQDRLQTFLASIPRKGLFAKIRGTMSQKPSGNITFVKHLNDPTDATLDAVRIGKTTVTHLFDETPPKKKLGKWAQGLLKSCDAHKIFAALPPAELASKIHALGFQFLDPKNKEKPLFDPAGKPAAWLQEALREIAPKAPEQFELFFKKFFEAASLLAFTTDGKIQPWLVKEIGPHLMGEIIANNQGGLHNVLPQILTAVEDLLCKSLQKSLPDEEANNVSIKSFVAIAIHMLQSHQAFRASYTQEMVKLAALKDQRLSSAQLEEINRSLNAHTAHELTKPPTKESINHLEAQVALVQEKILLEKTNLALKSESVTSTVITSPPPNPASISASLSIAPALLPSEKKAKELTLTLVQKDGVPIKASLVEQPAQGDQGVISRVTQLDEKKLDTRSILADAAKDYISKNPDAEQKLFQNPAEDRRFFARVLKTLCNNARYISRDTLLEALQQEPLLKEQIAKGKLNVESLTDHLYQTYKNTTEQRDPYLKNNEEKDPYARSDYFPSDAFIRLAKHQIDSLAQHCAPDKPQVIIDSASWDPHYVEAIMLYCAMKDYPKPEYQNKGQGWAIELITDEKKNAFKAFYNERFGALENRRDLSIIKVPEESFPREPEAEAKHKPEPGSPLVQTNLDSPSL